MPHYSHAEASAFQQNENIKIVTKLRQLCAVLSTNFCIQRRNRRNERDDAIFSEPDVHAFMLQKHRKQNHVTKQSNQQLKRVRSNCFRVKQPNANRWRQPFACRKLFMSKCEPDKLITLRSIRLLLIFFLAGLLSWNVLDCHVDLEEELRTLTQHAPDGEVARHGEYCFVSHIFFFRLRKSAHRHEAPRSDNIHILKSPRHWFSSAHSFF